MPSRYRTYSSSEDRRFKANEGKFGHKLCRTIYIFANSEILSGVSHYDYRKIDPSSFFVGLHKVFKETTERAECFKEEACQGMIIRALRVWGNKLSQQIHSL